MFAVIILCLFLNLPIPHVPSRSCAVTSVLSIFLPSFLPSSFFCIFLPFCMSVRVSICLSGGLSVCLSSTSVVCFSPHYMCVLRPFLYTLYTNDCSSVDSSTTFVRFSDDTAMLALLNDFASYQSYLSSVVRFSSWCSNNFLHVNVSKTKEMCIDFRRNRTFISPIIINGEPVEHVDSFKYLAFHLQSMLQPCKRSLSSDFLRMLRAFYVDPLLLLLRLYRSIIEPLLTYCSICYYPAVSVKNRNRLLKISHVSAKIIGLPTPKLSEIIDHAILKKAHAVATESDHPLSTFFHVLPSQRRYRCIKCKTCRYSRSFVPVAIRMLNAK